MIFGEWDEDMFVKVQSEIAVKYAARESAKNLLIETDLSPETISKCCSLPLDDVLTIKKELETETVLK